MGDKPSLPLRETSRLTVKNLDVALYRSKTVIEENQHFNPVFSPWRKIGSFNVTFFLKQ
tara:strand:+ start:2407 stop:2583 length:177 start_codon:yes stop_codon:yes gene_type:complete